MSNVSKSLLKGAKEALAHAKGNRVKTKIHKVHIPTEIDVKTIREKTRLTRTEFSNTFGFSIRTLEKWEQGIRKPDTAARAYLLVISHAQQAVMEALNSI